MTFDDLLTNRRSIHKYLAKPVSADLLAQIAEAGRLSPSSLNRQEWRFIAVTQPDLHAQMQIACNNQPPTKAPALLVAVSTAQRIMACGQSAATIDCSIALTCMMLKAAELGLGSCWLGAFSAEEVKRVLALAEDDIVVAVLTVGYPDETPAARPRKTLDQIFEIR